MIYQTDTLNALGSQRVFLRKEAITPSDQVPSLRNLRGIWDPHAQAKGAPTTTTLYSEQPLESPAKPFPHCFQASPQTTHLNGKSVWTVPETNITHSGVRRRTATYAS